MKTERQIYSLFPTPVGRYGGFERHHELIALINSLVEQADAHPNGQDPNLLHYFDRQDAGFLRRADPLILELTSWIQACALDFVVNALALACDELMVASSWLNRCGIGGSQAPHSHENSLISGTYYLNFADGHAPIRFWRPTGLSMPTSPYLSLMALAAERQTHFSAPEVQIAPALGTLLLWPSHLLHGHSGNALEDRLTLSFNLLPKRLKGSSYCLEIVDPSGD